jgi:beta-phosphoglucomutase-like phosphatase (HAD superfamily)
VVEDSISGIRSGRDGGFGLVIGVDHYNDPDTLTENGANLVVTDLGDLLDFGENKKGQ